MKRKIIKKGMKVLVKNDISLTHKKWTATSEMYDMRGKYCEVTGVRDYENCCRLQDNKKINMDIL